MDDAPPPLPARAEAPAEARTAAMPDSRPASASAWSEVVLALGLIAGLVVLLSVNIAEAPAPVEPDQAPFEIALRTLVGYLAAGAEISAALVIGWGVLRGVFTYGLRLVKPNADHVDATESIRLRLGRVLALGIEFTLASDILRTAVAPTRSDILTLGAIILLRTLLNIFLEREIASGEVRRNQADAAAA